jgi:hypothetical protein
MASALCSVALLFRGDRRAIGLNGSTTVSAPDNDTSLPSCLLGPGVEKSIKSSSAAFFVGDFPFPVLRFRSSSNVGMALGGVKGIVGFKIDLIGKGAIVCRESIRRLPSTTTGCHYLGCVPR